MSSPADCAGPVSVPSRSMLAASNDSMTSGRDGYSCGGISRSTPGRNRRIAGTSNGLSPNEATTAGAPSGRPHSACSSASIEPSASASGRTWQARQTWLAPSMTLTARAQAESLLVVIDVVVTKVVVILGHVTVPDVIIIVSGRPVRIRIAGWHRVHANCGHPGVGGSRLGHQVLDGPRGIR